MRAPVAVGPSRDRHTTSAPRPHAHAQALRLDKCAAPRSPTSTHPCGERGRFKTVRETATSSVLGPASCSAAVPCAVSRRERSSMSSMSWPGRGARAQRSFVVFNRVAAGMRALSCPSGDYFVSRPARVHQDATRVDRRRTHAIDHNRGRDWPCGDASTDAIPLEPANDIGIDGLGTCGVGVAAIEIALLDQREPSTIKGVYRLRVQM